MSLMMTIEFEWNARLSDIARVLAALGEEFESREDEISGYFTESNCRFDFSNEPMPDPLLAEGVTINWRVGIRGTFHYRAGNLEASGRRITEFVEAYAAACGSRFVLSFQYESPYAIRDEEGLVHVRRFTSSDE